MKWVLAGGTGFVGRRLASTLLNSGEAVVVLSRGESALQDSQVRPVRWSPGAPGAWCAELEGADVVLNLAGAGLMDKRWTQARLALLRSSRIEATDTLATAIANAKSRPRLLLNASAIGYYGMRLDDELLDETSPPGEDVLARLCRDWEQAAAPARAAGVRVAVARIGLVLGANGGALSKLVTAFKTFLGGPLGSGKQWVSWVHLDDVVESFRVVARAESLNGPFNVVAPEPVRMEEFARTLGSVLRRPSAIPVPALALRTLLGPSAEVLLTGQRVVPSCLQNAKYEFRFSHLRDALEDLLKAPRATTQE